MNGFLGMVLGVHTTGRLGGGFWCGHVALAVEVASRINDEARRVNVSQYNTVFFNLQPLGGMDISFYFPVTLMIRVWISPSTSP